jgi:hypothetical protein
MREDGSGKNWIVTVTNRTVSEKVFIHASWRKALPYKHLGIGGRADLDVSTWQISTYDSLANGMPIAKKMLKSFVKFSWQ